MTERELWSAAEAASFMGAATAASARHTLSRWGVPAVEYRPSASGRVEARYDAAAVRAAKEKAPGRGRRAASPETTAGDVPE
jgi:hypothetical protein